MTTELQGSVLVRTWFGDDRAWEILLEEVATPSDEDFLATVRPVDNRRFEHLSAAGLAEQHAGRAFVSFIADETTLTHAEHPILAVWVYENPDGFEPFRVVPASLWSVENNINLANMDWPDFTRSTGADGVYRGF